MTAVLDKLNQLMDHQLSLYDQLLQLCRIEQEFLIQNRGESLENLLEQQDGVIQIIEQNDKTRRAYFYNIAFDFGIEHDDVSFQKIIGLAPTPYSTWFETKYNRLAETIDHLNQVNQLNTTLISNTLKYTDTMIKLISRAAVSPHYNAEGEQAENTKKLLDTKR